LRGLFVTGSGTEVGKTMVAAVIARTLAAQGKRVAVFKPAITGLDDFPADGTESGDIDHFGARRPDHEVLRRAAGSEQADEEIAPYRYGPPASPHLAAALAGEEIDPKRLVAAARAATEKADVLICEGVGGLLVPLAWRLSRPIDEKVARPYLVRDFAVDLGLPVVIAASPGLGTINHTLLTVEAVRAAGLVVDSVVLTPYPAEPSPVEDSNRETIESLAGVRVETLPRLDLADPGSWPALESLPPA
jgi:dethiobiotin synthetase